MKPYAIEIYMPDNPGYDATCYIESDKPFMPIQKGDIINPGTWTSHYSSLLASSRPSQYGLVLRVTGIEHFIIQREDERGGGFTQHKLGVFTEALDNVAEARP